MHVLFLERVLHCVGVEHGFFVRFAVEAPVGGEIDKDRAAFGQAFADGDDEAGVFHWRKRNFAVHKEGPAEGDHRQRPQGWASAPHELLPKSHAATPSASRK